jgi:ABC-type glycerol-3-phosphate transport system permease component
LRFGKYTAKMLLVFDDGARDVPIEGVVSFWVIPWRLFIAAILFPLVPAFLVYYLMKRRMRKQLASLAAEYKEVRPEKV